ncbi:MAG: DUF4276 family protein, partial [Oscillospiraceae bacterium]|nr:DUF4276 family protein [Oscillospiraceae bacterium]
NFARGHDAKSIKSDSLLNDLEKRISAFNVEFKDNEDASLFVIVDNDTKDTEAFRVRLNEVSVRSCVSIDHVYCIAVEETEAWLLGDMAAIQSAYPQHYDRILSKHAQYTQDEIRKGGTWEFLAEMLTKNGFKHFKRINPTSADVGRVKSEWAERIGAHLDIRGNVSPSFQYFIGELDKRAAV